MTQTSNIETNRLVLRPFTESDAPDVFESCKNPNLAITPDGNLMKRSRRQSMF